MRVPGSVKVSPVGAASKEWSVSLLHKSQSGQSRLKRMAGLGFRESQFGRNCIQRRQSGRSGLKSNGGSFREGQSGWI